MIIASDIGLYSGRKKLKNLINGFWKIRTLYTRGTGLSFKPFLIELIISQYVHELLLTLKTGSKGVLCAG
jgi:hypothetical protein